MRTISITTTIPSNAEEERVKFNFGVECDSRVVHELESAFYAIVSQVRKREHVVSLSQSRPCHGCGG